MHWRKKKVCLLENCKELELRLSQGLRATSGRGNGAEGTPVMECLGAKGCPGVLGALGTGEPLSWASPCQLPIYCHIQGMERLCRQTLLPFHGAGAEMGELSALPPLSLSQQLLPILLSAVVSHHPGPTAPGQLRGHGGLGVTALTQPDPCSGCRAPGSPPQRREAAGWPFKAFFSPSLVKRCLGGELPI